MRSGADGPFYLTDLVWNLCRSERIRLRSCANQNNGKDYPFVVASLSFCHFRGFTRASIIGARELAMSQASPGPRSRRNAQSCKTGSKHWPYYGPTFWILQVTILLGIAALVSSCRTAALSTSEQATTQVRDTAMKVRVVATHKATQRQRRVAEQHALWVYRAYGYGRFAPQERPQAPESKVGDYCCA